MVAGYTSGAQSFGSHLSLQQRGSMTKYKLEYIWLDGYTPTPNLRGKTQIKEFASFPTLDQLPLWGFDGSSTLQAEGHSSDCVLKPVALYPDGGGYRLKPDGSIEIEFTVLPELKGHRILLVPRMAPGGQSLLGGRLTYCQPPGGGREIRRGCGMPPCGPGQVDISFHDMNSRPISLADYRAVVDVNQIGCFLGMQACYPLMKKSGGGAIVNIASVAGHKGVPGAVAYGASKWAIRGMTKTAALEFGRANVRVNAICPGSILTPMIAPSEFPGVDQKAFWSSLPIPRPGEAIEVAKVALFLASDDAVYVNGAELTIDGGETAGRMVEGIE